MGAEAQKLRQSVLQAAIEGKLVEQNPNDEPASVLLQRIANEKERLAAEKKIKKKLILPVTEEEEPFKIPESWMWARVSDVFTIHNGDRGKNYPAKTTLQKEGIPFISALNLEQNSVAQDANLLCVSQEQYDRLNAGKLHRGDMVVCIRGSLGKHGVYPFEMGAIASSLVFLRDLLEMDPEKRFLSIYLDSPLFYAEIKRLNNGTAQPNLAAASLEQFMIPIPPLAEQQRIVARLEEIMLLIDEFEALEDELTKLEQAFPEKLKQAILQSAFEGHLVDQDPNDEPTNVLLERIKDEKAQLLAEKKIKKQKPIPPVLEKEEPFEIPNGWVWVRLNDTGTLTRGSGIKRGDIVDASEYPCVRYGELYTTYDGTFSSVVSCTTEAIFNKAKKAVPGDILMALTGENDFDIALARPYVGQCEIAYGGDMTALHPIEVHYEYLAHVLNSVYGIRQKQKGATGDIIVHTSNEKLGKIPIPLPPLDEQHRIVAKLEEIMPLIDELQKAIANA